MRLEAGFLGMERRWWCQLCIAVSAIFFVFGVEGQQQSMLLRRLPNTTLQVPAVASVVGYSLENAFGNVTFVDPVAITAVPGETSRVFVVEQAGRISVVTNLAAPTRSVYLDLTGKVSGGVPPDERGLLGLAFHPGYATNGLFFVFYTGNATTATPGGTNSLHDILARFRVSSVDPNRADPASETRLIVQRDEANNHNAGDLHFGPDGYLYVSLGDEGAGDDAFNNSQLISRDFFSGMLRIDVDKRPGNLPPNPHPAATTNYLVPSDNPFVNTTSFNGVAVEPAKVRTEFWAVGLRNPWRFSFDRDTGDLYCADVGQSAWEEVNIITRGGNYGWAFREGRHAGPKTAPPGFDSIGPILEYGHGSGTNQGFSITGGVVYRGERLPELFGSYVFADYVSGNVWSLRYDGAVATQFSRIASQMGIAGFGVDPSNGDVLMANQNRDTIERLVYSTNVVAPPIPPTLADTGAFADLTSLQTHPGIVPYDVNVPFWSDNAAKTRWFSIPDTNSTIVFSRDGNWRFPTGTVWVKHFDLELTNGVPSSKHRLETRFIVKSATGVNGFTYRWGESVTNAVLVPEAGMDEPFVVRDGNTVRTQIWHYPSRQECNLCHSAAGGFAAGFNTAQLNRPHSYEGGTTNQIAALSAAGYFNTNVTGVHTLPLLVRATNEAASREFRVRSYLAANCVQCHQPGGMAQALWDARLTTPTPFAGIVNGGLINDLGDTNNRVVVPGVPGNSVMLTRISTLGPHRMPPIGSSVLDTQAIQLVSAWINNDLLKWEDWQEWQLARFNSTNSPDAEPTADPDRDGVANDFEFLSGTDPLDPGSLWKAEIQSARESVILKFPRVANRWFEVESTWDFASGAPWAALDVPGNEPFFPATNGVAALEVRLLNETNRFFRFRAVRP